MSSNHTRARARRTVMNPQGVNKLLHSDGLTEAMVGLSEIIERDARTISGEEYRAYAHTRPGRVIGIVAGAGEHAVIREAQTGALHRASSKNRGRQG